MPRNGRDVLVAQAVSLAIAVSTGRAVGGGSYEELMMGSERLARAWDSHEMA